MRRARAIMLLAVFVASQPALAADYYAGKTVTFIIGGGVGGGYDLYGRVVAKHLGRFIPGKPNVVVQNMEGASTVRATGYIYTVAPRDGTVVGAISPGAIIDPLLGANATDLYDPTKLVYLASANNSTRVCATSGTSKIKTFADARKFETIIGGVAGGGSTHDYAFLHKNTSRALFKIITGYPGTPAVTLAMERGEIDGVCGIDWSSLSAQKADMLREGKLNILVQEAIEPNEELTRLGVPMIWDFFDTEENRKIAQLVIAQQLFGRPFIAPPGSRDEAVAILRAAFAAAMRDPRLLADAARARLEILPAGGEVVQDGVERIYAAPRDIVEKARKAIRE
jgi:tripartite-type tricarboxylate transporter receptor subunit TctC